MTLKANWNEGETYHASDQNAVATAVNAVVAAVAALPTNSDVATVVAAAVAALVNSSPGTLDTLKELADAMADDPNFAATMATALAGKQPLDADLTAIAALVSAANKVPYSTGTGTWSLADFTAAGRAIVAAADAAAQRTALGVDASLTPTAVKTSAYTAAVNDMVPADASAGAFTVTLPSAPADKSRVVIKKIDSSSYVVTVAAGGSDVFNVAGGSTSLSLSLQYQGVQLQYKASGAIWYVVSTDVPLGALDTRYAPVQVDVPVGLGVTMSRYNIIANTFAATYRVPIWIPYACTNIRLIYTNWGGSNGAASGDITGPATVPLRVGLEIGGVIYRMTFSGSDDALMSPWGQVITDTLGVNVAAGTWIYARTYSNAIVHYDNRLAAAFGDGGAAYDVDLTAPGSGVINDSNGLFMGPSVVLATPTAGRTKTVLGVGDSIMGGVGDGGFFNAYNEIDDKMGRGGFMGRCARNNAFGLINIGISGENAAQWATAGFHARRLAFSRYTRTVVCDLGNNDIYNDLNAATTQASIIAVWNKLKNVGQRVFATNCTPRALTSTDGWTTVGNQTITTGDTQRKAINAWMRDGAPITIATGNAATTGVSAASTITRCHYFQSNTIVKAAENPASHPLYGTIEIADSCESARDSGKWKVPYGIRTVTDGVATNGGNTITSATANFTSADKGRAIQVAGAGAAGTLYLGVIVYINSSTSVNVNYDVKPQTTVSGATTKIYDQSSADGAHMGPMLCEEIAGVFPTNHFI